MTWKPMRTWMGALALGVASCVVAAGCSSEDSESAGGDGDGDSALPGDGDGDGLGTGGEEVEAVGLSTCEALCEASIVEGCADAEASCASACIERATLCPAEVADYFACGEAAETVSCNAGVSVGVAEGCSGEATAVEDCIAEAGSGAGGAGGAAGG